MTLYLQMLFSLYWNRNPNLQWTLPTASEDFGWVCIVIFSLFALHLTTLSSHSKHSHTTMYSLLNLPPWHTAETITYLCYKICTHPQMFVMVHSLWTNLDGLTVHPSIHWLSTMGYGTGVLFFFLFEREKISLLWPEKRILFIFLHF